MAKAKKQSKQDKLEESFVLGELYNMGPGYKEAK